MWFIIILMWLCKFWFLSVFLVLIRVFELFCWRYLYNFLIVFLFIELFVIKVGGWMGLNGFWILIFDSLKISFCVDFIKSFLFFFCIVELYLKSNEEICLSFFFVVRIEEFKDLMLEFFWFCNLCRIFLYVKFSWDFRSFVLFVIFNWR